MHLINKNSNFIKVVEQTLTAMDGNFLTVWFGNFLWGTGVQILQSQDGDTLQPWWLKADMESEGKIIGLKDIDLKQFFLTYLISPITDNK